MKSTRVEHFSWNKMRFLRMIFSKFIVFFTLFFFKMKFPKLRKGLESCKFFACGF